MTYKENRESLVFLSEDVPKDLLEYEFTEKSADDVLKYWGECYPAYEADFFRFKDSYLIPTMNNEIMKRIRKR